MVDSIGKFRLEAASDGTQVVCDRTERNGLPNACAWVIIYVESDLGNESIWVAETVPIHQDLDGGWSLIAGILTVNEKQAAHNRIYVRLFGPHQENNVFFDDISIVPIPKSCDNLVLNGNFEEGDSSFWYPVSRDTINVDISNYGANGSDYSMMIQKYTSHGMQQSLDTRCLVEGQEFLLSAKFRLLNATDYVSGVDCEPSIQNLGDSRHCPHFFLEGNQCIGNTVRYNFYNEIDNFEWDPNGFNDFEKVFTIFADFASCDVSNILICTN